MEFAVSKTLGPKSLIPLLFIGLILSFYEGTENSIIFYERLPKTIPRSGFLVFYQPTCPHCISEIPTIKKLIKLGYDVSAVNVFEARELSERFNVTETPTIVVLPEGFVLKGEQPLENLLSAKKGELFGYIGGGCNIGESKCS